ncbi:hypothetical protein NPX13_g11151 [Xylaria arbuscula]|uniref:Uncharacterized protein n=1 Tax=Xylaria arbuscula TaxID=114810 RepID=A0A9W8TG49_9PEZI|nr:hypothetical protein NPX13_g11151 [Xylaria arbuscula]
MTTEPPKSDGADKLSAPNGKPDAALETTQETKSETKPESNGGADDSPPNGQDLNMPPLDFKGELDTNNDLPSLQVLKAIENYTVFDHAGKTHPFKSLYSGHNVARRILVIFIRHFFCGVSC